MKNFKRAALAVVMCIILLISLYCPPRLMLFFQGGAYKILWQQEEPDHNARFYLTRSHGKNYTNVFVKDNFGWKRLNGVSTEDISVLGISLYAEPNIDTFGIVVAKEDYLPKYLDNVSYIPSQEGYGHISLANYVLETDDGTFILLYGFSAESFGSSDLVAKYLYE